MGVNILEDVKHSSVLYLCKYFLSWTITAVMSNDIIAEVMLHDKFDYNSSGDVK